MSNKNVKIFNGFSIEGVRDFYEFLLGGNCIIRHFYINSVYIIKTSRDCPHGRILVRKFDNETGMEVFEYFPYTGAGACGYYSIVERVYFILHYRNINHKKTISRKGLYIRGLCSNDNRTGGMRIIWRKREDRKSDKK